MIILLLVPFIGCTLNNSVGPNDVDFQHHQPAAKVVAKDSPPAWIAFRVVDSNGKPVNGVEVRFGNSVAGRPFQWAVGATTIFEGIASLEFHVWEYLPYNSGMYQYVMLYKGKEIDKGHSLPLNAGRMTEVQFEIGNGWKILDEYPLGQKPIPVLRRDTEEEIIFSFLLNDHKHSNYELFADWAKTGDFAVEEYMSMQVNYILYKTRGTFVLPAEAIGRVRVTLIDTTSVGPIQTMFIDL